MTRTGTQATDAIGVEVSPCSGYTGAEIRGVDLAAPLGPDTVRAIRRALLQWKVVFFRDQDLSPGQLIELGRHFGDVTPGHPTLPAAFPEHPQVLLLDYEQQASGGLRIEHRFHTDVSFVPNPPMGSILRGVVVPPYGGDTIWGNLAAAYATLSPEIRSLVDGLHAVHHNVLPIERGEAPSEVMEQFRSRELRAVHPMVRVHPETGEKILFVNPGFTSHVVELSRREGRHLLAMLYEHLADPSLTCRFRWEPDSVAFWDNRASVHLIPTDLPPGTDRVLHRITLEGDVPVGPDGSTSYALH